MSRSNILFVAQRPGERVLKIALALKKRGVQTSAIFRGAFGDQDLQRYFDFVRIEPEASEIARVVSRTPVDFVHLHAYAFDNVCAEIIYNSGKKIVYDPKDVFPGIMDGFLPKNVADGQLYLLQHAHGLIMRDGQAHLSARLLGTPLRGKRIFFPDLCWSRELCSVKSSFQERPDERCLKMIFIGNFHPERQFPQWDGSGQLRVFSKILQLGHMIHVYPSKNNVNHDYTDYQKLAVLHQDRLKFFPPVGEEQLLKKILPSYDFGIHVVQASVFPGLGTYWNDKLHRYGMAARIFDYLSAGLDIIVDNPTSKLLIEKTGFSLKLKNFDSFQSDMFNFLQGWTFGVERERVISRLSIDRYVDKLLNFYRSI